MLPCAPIGLIIFFIVAANAIFIIYRSRLPYPLNPWEAGIVADAWRMMQGNSIYAVGTDHATHMYGPLITVVLAHAFTIFGPVLEVGRFLSAISGTLVVLLLASVFGRDDRLAFAISVALLLAANTRSGYYFTETRPDMVSLFFVMVALLALYYGQERTKIPPRASLTVAGSVLLVIAVMFKQTAAAFMFVPVLAMLPTLRQKNKRVLLTIVPIVAIFGTLTAVWYFAPGVWHFIAEVPAQYKISVLRIAYMGVALLTGFPLFVLALIHWVFTDAQDTWQKPRVRWLLAAMICAIPSSLVATAKAGGVANSLIPAILSMSASCAWRVPVALALLRDERRSLSLRLVTGMLLGILVFAHTYPDAPGGLGLGALNSGSGTLDRSSVIAEARLLPGKVISPDDPTIALIAKGYAGRTAVFEADAVHWDLNRSDALIREIDSADYVITMQNELWWVVVKDDVLKARGFVKSTFKTTSCSVYELWRRMQLPGPAIVPLH